MNIHALYGIRRSIAMFTKARHPTLSWARWISDITISLIYVLILSSHLSWNLSSHFIPNSVCIPHLCLMHATCHVHLTPDLIICHLVNSTDYTNPHCVIFHLSFASSLLCPNILLSILFLKQLKPRFSLNAADLNVCGAFPRKGGGPGAGYYWKLCIKIDLLINLKMSHHL
jgi:hypothetical protein